jgi:hypothetical protein
MHPGTPIEFLEIPVLIEQRFALAHCCGSKFSFHLGRHEFWHLAHHLGHDLRQESGDGPGHEHNKDASA